MEWDSTVGLLAAVLGNCFIGVSQFLQKLALNRLQNQRPGYPRYRDPLWLLAIGLFLLGELSGNFFALSLTSPAVVAPLGSLAIVISGVLASRFLDEKISRKNQRGYLFLISGVLFVLFVSPKGATALTAPELLQNMSSLGFRVYLGLLSLAGLYLMWDLQHEKNHRVAKFILLSSILGSFTITCAKAVSVFTRLTLVEGNGQFSTLFPYVLLLLLVLSALGQEYYKQQAIGRYDASKFWPMFFASYNFFAVTITLVIFPGTSEQGLVQFVGFYTLGLLLILQGSLDTQRSASRSTFKSLLDLPAVAMESFNDLAARFWRAYDALQSEEHSSNRE